MWKSIVLCVSLFGSAALGLALGARFVEPAALPAAVAVGLCIIGVVLILAAPTLEKQQPDEKAEVATSAEHPRPTVVAPTVPFEALNS